MKGFASIEEAQAFFSGDRFATDNGMKLEELDENHSVTSMTIDARHRNALGGVMGGALAAGGTGEASGVSVNSKRKSTLT